MSEIDLQASVDRLSKTALGIKQQRDELIAVLSKISDEAEAGLHTVDSDGIQIARSLLAKLKS